MIKQEDAEKKIVKELFCKPDLEACMERVAAWFEGVLLDRPPIRFSRHNAEYERKIHVGRWPTLRERWFDAQYQLDCFQKELAARHFHAETFPVFWPNLGPNVFASCYGCPTVYEETTAWAQSILRDPDTEVLPAFDWDCEYVRKLDEMTDLALENSQGKFLVGYTDLHPGLDWVAALRGSEALLYDVMDRPEQVLNWICSGEADFQRLYRRYHEKLSAAGQPSVTWMNIPVYGKMHIPSCDFSSMISEELFMDLAFEGLAKETASMDYNIFHVDGKGVARHIDRILELPKLHAIQWVQGVGADAPILQWIGLIQKIQAAGKGIVADLTPGELDSFMERVSPKGIYLCIATESEEQELAIMKKVRRWTAHG